MYIPIVVYMSSKPLLNWIQLNWINVNASSVSVNGFILSKGEFSLIIDAWIIRCARSNVLRRSVVKIMSIKSSRYSFVKWSIGILRGVASIQHRFLYPLRTEWCVHWRNGTAAWFCFVPQFICGNIDLFWIPNVLDKSKRHYLFPGMLAPAQLNSWRHNGIRRHGGGKLYECFIIENNT